MWTWQGEWFPTFAQLLQKEFFNPKGNKLKLQPIGTPISRKYYRFNCMTGK